MASPRFDEDSPAPPSEFAPIPADLVSSGEEPAAPDIVDEAELPPPRPWRRRIVLPLVLFAVTCLSTFWAGATRWMPSDYFGLDDVRLAVVANWQSGLVYMACLLAILGAHEMGHFLMTVRYRIPASFPYFLPIPVTPIGTLGAVIGMDGLRANRRELFDIGLAGPLAGLVIAVPVMWIGIQQLDLAQPAYGGLALDTPLLVDYMLARVDPPGYRPGTPIWMSQLNPYFMAGWVGLLITGLNMLPVSQLDGGHVVYTLMGRPAHWVARSFLLLAMVYVVFFGAGIWTVMVVLVTLIGTDHPPTSNDTMPLGWPRTLLGWASLSIPVLCFPPQGFIQ